MYLCGFLQLWPIFVPTELPRWLSAKESLCQFMRHGFNPRIGKIPGHGKWQPAPLFLPGKSREQRTLARYWPWGCKDLDIIERLNRMHICIHKILIPYQTWTLNYVLFLKDNFCCQKHVWKDIHTHTQNTNNSKIW